MSRAKPDENGIVHLKYESYLRAQERQRVAEALLECAVADSERSRQWARECRDEDRRLVERVTYLYGLAASLGATAEQLSGGAR